MDVVITGRAMRVDGLRREVGTRVTVPDVTGQHLVASHRARRVDAEQVAPIEPAAPAPQAPPKKKR